MVLTRNEFLIGISVILVAFFGWNSLGALLFRWIFSSLSWWPAFWISAFLTLAGYLAFVWRDSRRYKRETRYAEKIIESQVC